MDGKFTKECPQKRRWRELWAKLMQVDPNRVDKFNFDVYKGVEAVFDTPTATYLPFLLKAYPNAKIIYTKREALGWMASRVGHPRAPKPSLTQTESLWEEREWGKEHER